ncbi:MAG: CapA family protein [Prochlorococcus sp.]|jgi:poly-gamma-glutamate synthesis protein (capsule biosynthesis protein)
MSKFKTIPSVLIGAMSFALTGYVNAEVFSEHNLNTAIINSVKAEDINLVRSKTKSSGVITFTFNAFGDSGWSDSHVARPSFRDSFRKAFSKFNQSHSLLGDFNYINWETTVGNSCDVFWSKPMPSHYAFLTPPGELNSAVELGFNLIGLANNHTYDCLQSTEGKGPLLTLNHIEKLKATLKSNDNIALFSGVFKSKEDEAPVQRMAVSGGYVPVRFLSAYVGGNLNHCKNMLCDSALKRYVKVMASQKGLRVLALHSWNPTSHKRLKAILRSWLARGLVDVAIGTGPHIAESVAIVKTPSGQGVLATSLGNFIHPSLGAQKNNIILQTKWSYDNRSKKLSLQSLKTTKVSCAGESCKVGANRHYQIPSPH